MGFVYDYQNNDYKVVRIIHEPYSYMSSPVIELYTLSPDSWKIVELGMSWRPDVVFNKINHDMLFPFVSGRLHWMLDMMQAGGRQ